MGQAFEELTIQNITDETPSAYTIHLEAPPDFKAFPGQFLSLRVEVDGELFDRSYSLSGFLVEDKELRITIKRVENGIISNYLKDHLKIGDRLQVLPPGGAFYIEPDPAVSKHYILIGAGSGISPLMAILRAVLHQEPLSKISLWYGNRNEEEIIFRKHLEELQSLYPNRLDVHYYLSQPLDSWTGPKGRLSEEVIYNMVLELFMTDQYRKEYFLCGPEGMIQAAEDALEKHAVHPGFVHREYFTAPVQEETAPIEDLAWEEQLVKIQFEGNSHEIKVSPGQTILQAAESQELDLPYSCRSGICSRCRAKLSSGKVHMDNNYSLNETDLEKGYILTCQAHPLTDDVDLQIDSLF